MPEKPVTVCASCEEQPAERKVTLTQMDGILLDEVAVCLACLPGVSGSKQNPGCLKY